MTDLLAAQQTLLQLRDDCVALGLPHAITGCLDDVLTKVLPNVEKARERR